MDGTGVLLSGSVRGVNMDYNILCWILMPEGLYDILFMRSAEGALCITHVASDSLYVQRGAVVLSVLL